ncbi:MAG: DUF6612 family protein [Tepidanaerobacteraceae bacterium]|jgi:hypothetical protein
MLKKSFILLLVLLLILPVGFALAEDEGIKPSPNAEAIIKVLENVGLDVSSDEGLSRGAYAVALCYAANIPEAEVETLPFADLGGDEWYLGAVGALQQKGILKGFPDGKLYGDNDITGIEAAALLARTFGVMEGPDTDVELEGLQKDHWGYTLYAWLASEGLTLDDELLLAPISAEMAAKFLEKAFYTAEEARFIIDMSNRANAEVSSLKLKGQLYIKIQVEGEDGQTQTIKPTATFNSEYSKDGIIHQTVKTIIPGNGPTVEVEQFIDNDYIYTCAQDEVGEKTWFKMKNPVPQVFDQSYLSQQQNLIKSIKEVVHYRIIEKEVLEDREKYKIALYSRMDDFSKVFDMIGYLSSEEKQNLIEANQLLKDIFIRGLFEIDSKDYFVHNANLIITADMDSGKQPESRQVIKSIVIDAFYEYYDYNVEVDVEIPAEALKAEEIVVE